MDSPDFCICRWSTDGYTVNKLYVAKQLLVKVRVRIRVKVRVRIRFRIRVRVRVKVRARV